MGGICAGVVYYFYNPAVMVALYTPVSYENSISGTYSFDVERFILRRAVQYWNMARSLAVR